MKLIIYALLSIAFVLTFQSCYKDSQEELYGLGAGANCDTSNVTFSGTVSPILGTSCATSGCHDATTQASGVNLSNHTGAKTIADNGKLIAVINHANGVTPMPQGAPKFDECTILKIQLWVNDGAPNN